MAWFPVKIARLKLKRKLAALCTTMRLLHRRMVPVSTQLICRCWGLGPNAEMCSNVPVHQTAALPHSCLQMASQRQGSLAVRSKHIVSLPRFASRRAAPRPCCQSRSSTKQTLPLDRTASKAAEGQLDVSADQQAAWPPQVYTLHIQARRSSPGLSRLPGRCRLLAAAPSRRY